MCFKNDRVSLIVGSKFTVFALFYFVFEGNFSAGLITRVWRGDQRVFCVTSLGSLYTEGVIFGILRYIHIYVYIFLTINLALLLLFSTDFLALSLRINPTVLQFKWTFLAELFFRVVYFRISTNRNVKVSVNFLILTTVSQGKAGLRHASGKGVFERRTSTGSRLFGS